jgi:hypothetical protein
MENLIKTFSDRIAEIQKWLNANKDKSDTHTFIAMQEELATLKVVIIDLNSYKLSSDKNNKTQLLNLKCSVCQQIIEEGEIVAIHNWGINTSDQVINYGRFVWNDTERKFDFESDKYINVMLDKKSYIEIDSYDLFRTSPRKLTARELEKLN